MAAPKGNDYNKALKTKAIKLKVYKHYCDHLSQGKPKATWYYDKDGVRLTEETIQRYIKEDKDFDASLKATAEKKNLEVWLNRGLNMMQGKVDKCQPAIYQIIMRNIFGWDKKDLSTQDQASLIVKAVHYAIEAKDKKKK